MKEKDEEKGTKAGSRQNRTKCKPSKDQHTSHDDMTVIPVALKLFPIQMTLLRML